MKTSNWESFSRVFTVTTEDLVAVADGPGHSNSRRMFGVSKITTNRYWTSLVAVPILHMLSR
jgi:hypothetical protein